MTCEQISFLLDSYVDGEFIDAIHVREIEAHLAVCAECARKLEAIRAVSLGVREQGITYQAPQHLLRNIAAIGAVEPEMTKTLSERRKMVWSFANVCVIAAAVVFLLTYRPRTDRPVVNTELPFDFELISAHIRSLQVMHLMDVKSTDKHTVKPWFQGKLDFSPDVPNLASDGFPLLGGRLDYVGGSPTAALIYGRAKHYINVFVRPSSHDTSGAGSAELDGYHIINWTEHNLQYWAVSDADSSALKQFADRFRAATAP